MFEIVSAKSWIAGHIRDLFRLRPVQLTPSTWSCVIQKGKVAVIHRHCVQPGDCEIMSCFLRPGQMPSRFKMNMAIRRNWPVLRPIALEGIQRSQAEDQPDFNRQLRYGT